MKKTRLWVVAAILTICGTTTVMTGCKEATQKDNPAASVQSTELIRTSQSWDGVELPDYLKGRPELVAVKYVFPAGKKLGWHHHPVMNYGILVQGELDKMEKRKSSMRARLSWRWSTPSITERTEATKTSSSICSTSLRKTCPWLCSTQRFRWNSVLEGVFLKFLLKKSHYLNIF